MHRSMGGVHDNDHDHDLDDTPAHAHAAPVTAQPLDDQEGMASAMEVEQEHVALTIDQINREMSRRVSQTHSEEYEAEVIALVTALGAEPRAYGREQKTAMRRVVCELYSPPRVTSMLREMSDHGMTAGFALDLTTLDPDDGTPWDFDKKEKREKAMRMIRKLRPLFVVGSPMCTRWSSWQYLNDARAEPSVVRREKLRALVHLEFMSEIYRGQVEG